MEVGQRLKSRREELKLTQEYVAEMLGVSRQTISNWENGRSYPDIERIVRLSDIYELSLDELLKGDLKMVSKLQKDTQINQVTKRIVLSFLLNALLMIVMMIVAPQREILFFLFTLIALNSLSIFYMIIRKI